MTSCCFFVSHSSICFATDEDGSADENFCNTLFKCKELEIKETTKTAFSVSFLDTNGQLSTSLNDKTDDINFIVLKFPHLDSNN